MTTDDDRTADDTRSRLLDAAGRVFAEKGFEAATVREICRAAEVGNIAAVNYYFGDKNRLYQEVVRIAFKGSADPLPEAPWPADAPAADRLRAYVTQFAAMLIGKQRPPWHYHLMAREMGQPTEGCIAFVREFAGPNFNVLRGLLREVLPAGTPAERVDLTALSMIGQIIHHRCGATMINLLVGEDKAQAYDAERIGRHVADFSLAALGLAPPLNREV